MAGAPCGGGATRHSGTGSTGPWEDGLGRGCCSATPATTLAGWLLGPDEDDGAGRGPPTRQLPRSRRDRELREEELRNWEALDRWISDLAVQIGWGLTPSWWDGAGWLEAAARIPRRHELAAGTENGGVGLTRV